MFMFMTTMWMYQLPFLQGKAPQLAPPNPQPDEAPRPKDPSLFASDFGEEPSAPSLSLGSWTGVMQQVPVTIGGSGGVNFEATLTLNPIQNTPYLREEERQKRRSRVSERETRRKEIGRVEKNTLENLRRSPYFSMNMFGQPRKTTSSFSRGDDDEHSRRRIERIERPIIENKEKKEKYKDEDEKERTKKETEVKEKMEQEQQKSRKEEEDLEFSRKVLSEAEARSGVEDLISQVRYFHFHT